MEIGLSITSLITKIPETERLIMEIEVSKGNAWSCSQETTYIEEA